MELTRDGPAQRWVGTGHSHDADPVLAGRQAARAAVAGRDPVVLIVFASIRYDLEALLAAVRAEAPPGTPLAGCTTAGELSNAGVTSGGVVVAALGGAGMSATVAVGRDASQDQRAAGVAAAACLERVEGPSRALLLLTPALVAHLEEIVRGAYSVTGATVPLVGGSAADDLAMDSSVQFAGGELLRDAVVGIGIGSDGPIGVSIRHGWRKVGEPMVVSHSDGALLERLDDEPALDVYLDCLDAPAEVRDDPIAYNRFALAHPLGLERHNGIDIRVPGEVDYATGVLRCTADMPRGALAWVMEGDEVSMIEAAADASADASSQLGDLRPVGALAFDCIGRRLALGDDLAAKESDTISSSLGGAPYAGFYTYGEIARLRGSSGVHNETFVIVAFG